MTPPAIAYKVMSAGQMAELLEHKAFSGAPIDLADGYIHLSTADQLTETVNKHFAGQSNLQIAEVDLGALETAIRWEQSRGGQSFPHLYAALPLSAVVAHGPLERGIDGTVILPG